MDDSALAFRIGELLAREPWAPGVAGAWLHALAHRHGIDPGRILWWDGAPAVRAHACYDDGMQGLARLAELLGPAQSEIQLIVSDERAGPWPVWSLPASELVPLLGELPFFEYAVVLDEGATLVFDTHHNTLLVSRAA
ncbi:hypothetical protein [Stenotrophomonas sp. SAU14A_NAIMI4_8]|uniref:hypothetical protein n=1 Tax=Stenotrophomonas sp. SAU14A_NAIMI4_8 TaxID=2072409 RepID=UPI000D540425|nr:hypothetical protein [Stenotrophomonas sp. SAU14A_NAIMI4_8]AWH31707.1 hypothetical protein C1930_01880 [Stenotrophomonas sp. SAU14A_NAIMI4_8]